MKNSNFIIKVLDYFNLESEVDDFDKIHDNIVKDTVFKGTNLWILMFAIVIASVGLNMNSTAVIIGAMLISPLMGPINGMGYSLATYNFPLFRKSIKHFTFAVATSLVASTTYFAISPISSAHSELLARTSPTIYDVLIALFGGLAGIVAICSKQKGNVIPGVAIATALMPPLCTAGYGLATSQINFFLGAIYLFTINTVFIALSSVAVSQFMKFPIRTIVGESHKKNVNRWITVVIILVLFPSVYFGYQLVQNEKFIEKANHYILNVNIMEGNYLLNSGVNANKRTITLVYGGTGMSEDQQKTIKEKRTDFELNNASVIIKQGLTLRDDRAINSEVDVLKLKLESLSNDLRDKTNQLDSIAGNSLIGRMILEEISTIYPQISSCAYGQTIIYHNQPAENQKVDIVLFTLKNKNLSNDEKRKIRNWLQTKLKSDNVRVYYGN